MNIAEYHPDWRWISMQIREQADHQCEWCGVPNHAVGARDRNNHWHNADAIDHMNSDVGYGLFGDYPKIIRIVLTVAHIDHDKANNDPSNLAALCQRCHLNHDRLHHAETRRRKRAAQSGQLSLVQV